MTRRTRWIAGLLLAALAAVLATAFVLRRPAPRLPPTAAPAEQAIELAPGDVARAERAELLRRLEITGSLKAVNSAVVKARIAAVVQTLDVREGDRVTAGQRIGQLDATDAQWRFRQAEEQALAAQSQLDIAQRTLANNRALVEQGFISRNALDTSSASAAGAAASLQAARAAAELARKAVLDSEIRAPIPGLVAQRLVQPGARVPLDARLLAVVDLPPLGTRAAGPPAARHALAHGQAGRRGTVGRAGLEAMDNGRLRAERRAELAAVIDGGGLARVSAENEAGLRGNLKQDGDGAEGDWEAGTEQHPVGGGRLVAGRPQRPSEPSGAAECSGSAGDWLARILAERRAQWAGANPRKPYVEPKGPDVAGLGGGPGGGGCGVLWRPPPWGRGCSAASSWRPGRREG